MNPLGHIPGYHIPGTLVPGGAVIAAQQEQNRIQAAQQAEIRRSHEEHDHLVELLLLLS